MLATHMPAGLKDPSQNSPTLAWRGLTNSWACTVPKATTPTGNEGPVAHKCPQQSQSLDVSAAKNPRNGQKSSSCTAELKSSKGNMPAPPTQNQTMHTRMCTQQQLRQPHATAPPRTACARPQTQHCRTPVDLYSAGRECMPKELDS